MTYFTSISGELITILHIIDIICEWVINIVLVLMLLHFISLIIYIIDSLLYSPKSLDIIDYSGSAKKYIIGFCIILLMIIIGVLIPSVSDMTILFNN